MCQLYYIHSLEKPSTQGSYSVPIVKIVGCIVFTLIGVILLTWKYNKISLPNLRTQILLSKNNKANVDN